MNMSKNPLFQPKKLGSLSIPNHAVLTTVKLSYRTQSGDVNDRYIAFYIRRAQGEANLLATEPLFIQENGHELPTQPGINDDVVHTDTMVTDLIANTAFAQRNDHEAQFSIKTGGIAIGILPDRELVDPLERSSIETDVVGDAVQPKKALDAIWESFATTIKY
jgi:2,4-dienoyl-CoA reductase-like NADH-dependent reductase (Old Yellow Enzyme family)